ncbi:MAG: biotin synthase BioB [Syntrophomonadaceae bacterium]|nr:biotin synthase BioB [Syntrophomonadaceae bacterium]
MSNHLIDCLENKVLSGEDITIDEAKELAQLEGLDLYQLFAAAARIRDVRAGKNVDLCSIINAISGNCTEDCKYCAQSGHYQAQVEIYGLLDEETILARARQMEAAGAARFSLVTSGRDIAEEDFSKVLAIYRRLALETNLKLCASLGIITQEMAEELVKVGVIMYHHNLETAASYFPQICTTHTYEERVATIKAAQRAGMEVCSGGIISMGESMEQRFELAFALKELGINSVPINILHPIKGTALEGQPLLPPLEILKTIAIFRFILPEAKLRFAGGRENALGDLLALGYMAGINASLVGSYLTTSGRSVAADIKLIKDLGLVV